MNQSLKTCKLLKYFNQKNLFLIILLSALFKIYSITSKNEVYLFGQCFSTNSLLYCLLLATKPPFKWEDATSLDGSSWGYRRDMKIEDVQPIDSLIKLLIRTVRLAVIIHTEFVLHLFYMTLHTIYALPN